MKQLVINKEDLKHNIDKIKKYVKETSKDNNCTIIGIVKGNGYGLDLIKYSKFLTQNGIEYLAVATLEEALKLKKENITKNILMLSALESREDIEEAIKNEIIITVDSKENTKIVNELKSKGYNIRVHIKIDTGFGRYGFLYNDYENILECIKSLKENNVEVEGIFSHFSIAYYKNNKHTIEQFEKFQKVLELLKENNIEIKLKHICNSPAMLNYPKMHLTAVRVGSAFVGRVSSDNNIGLKKIGNLEVNIAKIREMPENFNISYLNIYKTKRKTKIAILPIGYIEGYNLSARTDMFRTIDKIRRIITDIKSLFKKQSLTVEINEKKYNVIGTIRNVSYCSRHKWK